MKKFISLMLCVCILLLSSVSVFAVDWTNTDSSNLQSIADRLTYNGSSAARILSNINSHLSTLESTVNTISNALTDGGHSITYWVNSISTWMNPIYSRLQDILRATTDPTLNAISSLLGYPTTDSNTGVTSWTSYLRLMLDNVETSRTLYLSSHGLDGTMSSAPFTSDFYTLMVHGISSIQNELAYDYSFIYSWLANGYNAQQTYVNPLSLQNANFTPSSISNGIYTWLSKIQEPTARLSYVLASPERIEAQKAAAANEEAVVDNFIDSSGSGAASTSDFGSVSNLSSGFKNKISTDANVSGIWNIFNSDNFGWFSQETADQLDTTGSGNRTLRNSKSYSTPLLDQQTEDILKYIGGDDND